MRTSELSFLSCAEKLTLAAYTKPRKSSVFLSETVSRLAAVTLLSSGAAIDLGFHTFLILPTFVYAIGKSIQQRKADFTLPWQHVQRIRNAISPLLFGSVFGALHPFAGLALTEATDKHAVVGMLSSNAGNQFETPCSPIHSLAIVENIAKKNRYVDLNGERKEIFSREHKKALKDAKTFENSLEILQAQEYIHKITNVTLFIMANITKAIDESSLNEPLKEVLLRFSGVLIPVLTVLDITTASVAQIFFLATGLSRLISGRGPIYTEVTANPLMHVAFLIQNILKSVGNLIGTVVWFVSPMTGFKVSLLPSNLFFKAQMSVLLLKIKLKMHFEKDDSRFVIPIVFGNGVCSALSVPTHSMHKTYLIVEKKGKIFNLYSVNRPDITTRQGISSKEALKEIRSMLDARFPFMDIKKLLQYPVKADSPDFSNFKHFGDIAPQGNMTNCVVTNMFGMLEGLDQIKGVEEEISELRNECVRKFLLKDYGFYKKDFYPFANAKTMWDSFPNHLNDPI